jgi:hypothetical protein
MPVPSSGELKLRADINLEVNGNATDDNVSLGSLSNEAGFTEPDTMSEFYGYTSCTAPSVTTNALSSVSYTSMTANGNVTADNGCTITERGFYFGTNGSSPTNNTKYSVGGTTGSYSRNMTGLNASTNYYCWAYATNSAGTTYGARVNASTLTPATYTLVQTYTNVARWYSPAYWANGNSSWTGVTYDSNAQAQYHHASYGYTNFTSYSNSWFNTGSLPSSYSPYLNDYRYKRTDTTEYTEHRRNQNYYQYGGTLSGFEGICQIEGGNSSVPSGCASGSSTSSNYITYGYSGCSLGCTSGVGINCNCGNTNVQWYNAIFMEAKSSGVTGGYGANNNVICSRAC